MVHFVYKITNLINGCYYIGMHSTENEDDGYMGSGFIIRKAIKKHGLSNFKREILFYFPTRKEALQKESHLLSKETIQDPKCYNICTNSREKFNKLRVFDLDATDDGDRILPHQRADPQYRCIIEPVPENIAKWESYINTIPAPKDPEKQRRHNFYMMSTRLLIEHFAGVLKGIEYSLNRKKTHADAKKLLDNLYRSNLDDCYKIREVAWV